MRVGIPSKWNIFESDRDFKADFFSRSPYSSMNFTLATVLLSADVGLGLSIALAFWPQMPTIMKTAYSLFLIGLPIVWVRMRRDYWKMRTWRSTAPPQLADSYPVQMASHLITFAPYYLYFLVLILLFCLWGGLHARAGG